MTYRKDLIESTNGPVSSANKTWFDYVTQRTESVFHTTKTPRKKSVTQKLAQAIRTLYFSAFDASVGGVPSELRCGALRRITESLRNGPRQYRRSVVFCCFTSDQECAAFSPTSFLADLGTCPYRQQGGLLQFSSRRHVQASS